uniref:Uncharacterized protein n=1 Tax=Aliivibrio fischeri TaxID=668 RepID=H2ERR0_ALIFS|nr:hypothetical protein [Aliivibrio fischeri]AEY78077.1 hypothetical protein [Aliivibrio fischeri]
MFDLGSLIEAWEQPYKLECTLIADQVFSGDIYQHRKEAGQIGSKHDAYFNVNHFRSHVGRFAFINDETAKSGKKTIIRERQFGEIIWDREKNILIATHYGTSISREMIYSCMKID